MRDEEKKERKYAHPDSYLTLPAPTSTHPQRLLMSPSHSSYKKPNQTKKKKKKHMFPYATIFSLSSLPCLLLLSILPPSSLYPPHITSLICLNAYTLHVSRAHPTSNLLHASPSSPLRCRRHHSPTFQIAPFNSSSTSMQRGTADEGLGFILHLPSPSAF